MPEIAVVNSEGAEVGRLALSSEIFETTPSIPAMHSAVVAYMANRRSGTSNTLTRGEVRGGGRKPFRQKGTGRARQGSIRAPYFPGGGIVFGPHPRDYDKHMPKKMRRLAIRSAFAAKLTDEAIKIVEDIKQEAISTKALVTMLNRIGIAGKVLLVIHAADDVIKKSAKNVPWITLRVAPSVSTYDLLNADSILITKDAMAMIEEAQAK